MNLVDVEDAVLYPSIRDTESEKDVEIIYTDMVANGTQESTYFPYSFRLHRVVIDLLGNQYMRSIEEYSEDEGYIIGEQLCEQKNLKRLAKEYLPVKNGETPVKDTGMYLRPDEKIKFSIGDNYTAYIRATKVNRYGAEQKANVVVETAMASGGSGGSMDHDCCCCCKSGFKEWYSGMAVSVGTYVEHDNKIYKCIYGQKR